jgi:hypothetical protein
MAIILNDNVDTRAPKPSDSRFGPYTTTAAALANIPEYQRYIGLTVGVGTPIVEYWFDSTLTLVLKTSSGTVTGITAGTGINIGGTAIAPIISVTSPTQLTTNISTDVIADGASDVKYPSAKATKTYVDANVAGLLDDRGNFPATSGDYPTTGGSGPAGAIRKGDLWFISVPGNLNGIAVGIGASVRALVDDAQPTTNADWDILDTGLGFIPENVANKVIRGTSIAAAPTSETLYASLSALTEYLASIPASTPTLEQVLAATPTQTAEGYDINLESLDGNLTTNVGRGEFNVTNVSAGTSVTVFNDAISIASVDDDVFITYDTIEFNNNTLGTLTLNAVQNNNTVTLPNQTATLIASVNSSIFADTSTGDITIPLIGSTGTENFIPKWSSSSSLGDSIVQQVGTNNIQIGSSSLAGLTLDLFSSDRVDFRMYPYSTTTDYFGIYSYGPTGYGSSYTQIGLNDGIISNQQGAALYLDTRASLPPLSLMVKDATTNFMTYALSVATNGNVGIGTTTPGYKLDVNGTGRFVNDLYADEDLIINNYFTINTTATTFPLPDGTLGIWRRKINGAGTYFIEDEQATKDKWAFVKRSGYNSTTAWSRDSSSIVNINLGWANPNQSNLDGSTLLINPTIRIGDLTNTGTKIRGIYYNPTLDSLVNTTHIAFENTSGDNYLNSSSGNTLIGYSTPPLTPFKLEVNGEISTVTGVRIASNRTKTGIYPYDSYGGGLDFYAANSRLATFRLTNPGGQHYLFDAGHTYDNSFSQLSTASMVIQGSVSPTGPNSVPITQLLINPTYAQTPSGIPRGTGTLRGIYYSPTVTSLNTSAHVAFENVTGNVLLGTTSGNVGIKNNNPQYTLDLEGSANFKLADNTPAVPYANKLSVRNGTLRLGFTLDANYTFRYIQFTDETDLVENFMFGATKGLYNPALGISDPANTAINNPVIAMAQKDALYIMSGAASPDALGDKTALVIKNDGRVKYRPLPTAPTTNLEEGDTYYDSGLQKLRVYTATGWQNLN